ncbi:DUF721 domain-containing protein [Hwanghaeella sp.]|uniref:DUF721 domain-containing protein n=1 Tax=Hwanghaeella sp. TaxID=2605943 RepID=UPI003CCC22D3
MPEPKTKNTDSDGAKEKRRGGMRVAGSLVGALTKKALGKRGFASAAIITDWATIVGPDLAKHTRPQKLTFPKGRRDGGTVHILTSGPMALQLQHLAPMIIDRINGFFGYGAVSDIRLVQGALTQGDPRKKRYPTRQLTPADEEHLATVVDGITDEALRERVRRLGLAVLRHSSATKPV